MATGIQLVLGITGTGKNRVSETQSVLFDKSRYTVGQAKQWLKSHGYKDSEVDVTKEKLRFRQQAPAKFKSFATKSLGNPNILSRAYKAAFPPSITIRESKGTSTYKGYKIYPDPYTGGYRTTAERESEFDSKKDAQRFIDSLVKGRNPSSKEVSKMTAGEINKELDKLDKEDSKLTSALIAAGRGNERFSEIVVSQDEFSRKAKMLWDRRMQLRNEIEARYGPGAPSRLPKGFGPISGRNPGNLAKATSLSEQFHGRPSKETIDITESDTQRTDYALLGELKELEIVDGPKSVIPISFKATGKDCVYLAASPSGEQLYLISGDQFLDLSDFDYLTDTERKKDKIELGLLHSVTYHTDKHHLEGPATQRTGEDYFHVFASPVEGAGDGEKPLMIYDRLNERLEIAGGSYCVKDVGIVG